MGIERAFAGTRLPAPPARWGNTRRVGERLRHLAISCGLILGAVALFLFEPIDQFLWLFQSKIAGQKASGDIVFVESDQILDDPNLGHRRLQLAKALDELDRRGVGKVYLDVVFEERSEKAYDAALAGAIERLGPRISVADWLELDTNVRPRISRTDPSIAGQTNRVIADRRDDNYFNVNWKTAFGFTVDGERLPTLGASLGGDHTAQGGSFQIDYGFPGQQIASAPLSSLTEGSATGRDRNIDFAGKTVVIGHDKRSSGSNLNVPNSTFAPPSYISIYAGETLKSGRGGYLYSVTVIAVYALLLAVLVIVAPRRRNRWLAYAALAISVPALLFLTARLGYRIEISYAAGLLAVYAIYRWRARWKRRLALVNQETGLPTIKAFDARMVREPMLRGHVVVAKVHNYERILKSLAPEERTTYLLRLVDRLRAVDPDLTIFSEGHYVAWHSTIEDRAAMMEHLAGLRAIFAAPVVVGDVSVDVGITFGVSAIDDETAGRVPAAMAAAEETSEAHEPVKFAESGENADLLWDISLRARIDEAMEAGEIYCVYQPKIDTATGAVAGVEALVRWHDPAKGFIEPMHFVQQCEKAGRMEHLTRYVLQSACSAGQLLHFRNAPIKVSVNISATLLRDMRVVGLVRNALQATRLDPQFLILEITETSRIADLETASTILDELLKLGVGLSIDDFGVGAANFETFFSLPFTELKIDRLFVSNIVSDPKARAIVSSIIEMGHQARITVVAEGVETMKEAEILNEMGCDELQGYVFSKPISLSKLLEFNAKKAEGRVANMV